MDQVSCLGLMLDGVGFKVWATHVVVNVAYAACSQLSPFEECGLSSLSLVSKEILLQYIECASLFQL